MRRVKGYRGEFWGCPEYPACRKTGGSAAQPPEVVEAAAKARRIELMSTYNAMKESTRERLRKEIEEELTGRGALAMIKPEEMPLIIASKYSKGAR
jgi:ssDNA-binding Zn-finger/Zn-ribbon topoisomerase 1